jgi:hypothetical protein
MISVRQVGQVVVQISNVSVKLVLSREDTIADIKTLIANQTCIPSECQHLTFAGMPLNDNYTLGDYQILPGSHISWTVDCNLTINSAL